MAEGEQVPLVLLPRWTTFAGANTFVTVGLEVTDFDKAVVNVYVQPGAGTTPTFTVSFEESTDQDNWSACSGGTATAVTPSIETQFTPTITRRWFRIKVTLGGTNPVMSCWAIGFLQMRVS